MSQSTVVIAIVVAAVVAVAVVIAALAHLLRGRSADGVDSFRRQIDALSPEARRPVIDQMYHDPARGGPAQQGGPDGHGADPGRSAAGDDDPGDTPGQDGAHGA